MVKRDAQDMMRAELARSLPKATPRVGKAPRPISIGPAWVAACFTGGRPRFLAPDPRGGWAVKLTPVEAHGFESQADAERAIDDFRRRHAESTFDAGAAWSAREMTLTATFRQRDPDSS